VFFAFPGVWLVYFFVFVFPSDAYSMLVQTIAPSSSFKSKKPTLIRSESFIRERDYFWQCCSEGNLEIAQEIFYRYTTEDHVQVALVMNKLGPCLSYPIHIATEHRHAEVVRFLVSNGKCNVNVKDKVRMQSNRLCVFRCYPPYCLHRRVGQRCISLLILAMKIWYMYWLKNVKLIRCKLTM
jgi:hypothetical protein